LNDCGKAAFTATTSMLKQIRTVVRARRAIIGAARRSKKKSAQTLSFPRPHLSGCGNAPFTQAGPGGIRHFT
jgi:hypothetical protein